MLEVEAFNPLNRDVDVHQSYLLEASAGTGKTFSIENVVVRLLIDSDEPPSLDQIAVVTFTRAATRELATRIRQRIQQSIDQLGDGDSPPDYLLSVIEKGERSIRSASQRLERALACYDDAQIFTIHGFCTRLLSEYGFEAEVPARGDSELSVLRMLQVVRDTLRTDVVSERYSPVQLKILLGKYLNDDNALSHAVLRVIKKNIPIESGHPWSVSKTLFWQALLDIKGQYGDPSTEDIIRDFLALTPMYKGICDRQGNIKPDLEQSIRELAALFEAESLSDTTFDMIIASKLVACNALTESNRKARAKEPAAGAIALPGFFESIQRQLGPIIGEASSDIALLARLSSDCRKRLIALKQKEELMGPDDILEEMSDAVNRKSFRDALSGRYRCAIVDEFQDTDPLQWHIFRSLFVEERVPVYLVGDPKQSIYAFRNADIYTYLNAANVLGQDHHRTLDTNYRSQEPLIKALNLLFSAADSSGFIDLPRTDSSLPFHPVRAGGYVKEVAFTDGGAAIRFIVGEGKKGRGAAWPTPALEEEQFLSTIAVAIQQMHRDDHLPLSGFAVLVRDRFQGDRVVNFLRGRSIATAFKRTLALTETSAIHAVRYALMATLSPTDLSMAKIALGTRLLGWTESHLAGIGDDEHSTAAAGIVAMFQQLHQTLGDEGCSGWYQALLQTRWGLAEHEVPDERLCCEVGGLQYLDEVTQVAERLVDYQSRTGASGDRLLQAFAEMTEWTQNEDDRIKVRSETGQEAVTVMTLHASKGLEFDVVFPLGLASRSPKGDGLVRLRGANGDHLARRQSVDCPRTVAYHDEMDAEKMRQLYVAMTRAKLRLMLPVAFEESAKGPPDAGTASPMELFMARILAPAEDRYESIPALQSEQLTAWVSENGSCTSIDVMGDQPHANADFSTNEKESHSENLKPPPNVDVPGRRRYVVSFSALARKLVSLKQVVEHPEDEDFTVHHLPAGSETGNLVHGIFESIKWPQVNELQHPDGLWSAIAATPWGVIIEEQWHSWKDVLLQLFFDTFTAQLDGYDPFGDSFTLAQVGGERTVREMEFLHPWKHPVAGMEMDGGFLKGFIDLIFEHNGRYYIVDWKTNRLGIDSDAYSKERLNEAMEAHHYTLQAKVYTRALRRYLSVIDQRPFEEVFGGAYYLFLRGLGDGQGIAYISPERALEPLHELEKG
ncbi:hypothetical protein SCG7086_AX_00080 [Chlamydiales bacterium SCGC AG-110-P3]|nr:hypothetical protein SCG7086_AX_00080 [Chlamydiales bacterium SCGC AG-110-P3]